MKFKLNVPKVWLLVKSWGSVHSPAICTGVGIALGVATVVTAVKETPKALYLIRQYKQEAQIGTDYKDGPITTIDKIKVAWKPYIAPAALGAASITFILLGQKINSRRIAALSAALSLSETTYSEYQDKVKELFGKNKEQSVRDKIAQDKVNETPVSEDDVIYTGAGDTLFYDATSGRYFKSDLELIKRGINEVNYGMMNGMCMYACLNDVYSEWGLKPICIGEDLGWNINDGLIDIRPISTMISDSGKPCIVLEFTKYPSYEYKKLY